MDNILREVKYGEGKLVKCVEITAENHEKLKVGQIYAVTGFNVFDNNIVYCLKDIDGKLYYSTDRFVAVAETGKLPKLEIPVRVDDAPAVLKELEKVQMASTYGTSPAIHRDLPNEERFCMLQEEMLKTYIAKNTDYGDSVSKTHKAYGIVSFATRIADKYHRVENLIVNGKAKVKGESMRDTLLDMANYCMLAIMEMDADKQIEPKKLTTDQRKVIISLTHVLSVDRTNLPVNISPVPSYNDLTEIDADMVITILRTMVNNKKSGENICYL